MYNISLQVHSLLAYFFGIGKGFSMRSKRRNKRKWYNLLYFIVFTLVICYVFYPKNEDHEKVIRVDKGRKVKVEMPNGQIMTTYEKYIVREGSHIYYKSDDGKKIDLTGGTITYK